LEAKLKGHSFVQLSELCTREDSIPAMLLLILCFHLVRLVWIGWLDTINWLGPHRLVWTRERIGYHYLFYSSGWGYHSGVRGPGEFLTFRPSFRVGLPRVQPRLGIPFLSLESGANLNLGPFPAVPYPPL